MTSLTTKINAARAARRRRQAEQVHALWQERRRGAYRPYLEPRLAIRY